MEGIITLVIQLASGALGGNLAGAALKNFSLGTVLNSVVGILGGGLGGQLLSMLGLGLGDGGIDIASIIGSVASGGVGGSVLLAIVGVVKKLLK